MPHPLVTEEMIETYQTDGVVVVRGLFADWVAQLRAGIERNMAEPGPFASENHKEGETGRFFDDYCNWQRIPVFQDVIHNSPAAQVGAELMRSRSAQMFHDHVLVKEPGTSMATPWHSDGPYYFVEGQQTISFWAPLDPVREATLRMVPGSHRWEKPVLPMRWVQDEAYFPNVDDYMPVPDPDAQGMPVVEFEMEPGDAVAFNYHVLHGSRGNTSASRRRAFSLRLVGDDARYVARPGRTSPPFPGHDMQPGQRLREDWFPVIWQG